MIFRLSYSWLKEFIDVPKDAQVLAGELSRYGASIDRVHAVRHEFTNVVVAEILKIEPHPNADKVRLTTVTTGKGKPRLVVCGAPNIEVGQKVPLALPGATLPGGLTIARREMRGITSDGMLCSARELGIHNDHVGILVLHSSSKLGTQLTDLGAAEDFLLEVEPTTNRPDVASVLGVAREVGAMTGKSLRRNFPKPLATKGKAPFTVRVEDKKLCPRLTAAYVKNVTVQSSPWWMQERLARAGIRPINAIVDITNYVLLEYGQPMHVYDADIVGDSLTVRHPKPGESMLALNGQRYNLTKDQLITVAKPGPVDIAGVMGSEDSGVTMQSKNVIFKAATWDPVLVRRMSRQLNLSSEASKLFEKGLSTEAPPYAVARAVELAKQICGGTQVGPAVDVQTQKYRPITIKFPLSELERLLGVVIPTKTVIGLLTRLGFTVRGKGSVLNITVPFWRDHDVKEPHDIVEEVARLYGYHKFPNALPAPSLDQAIRDPELETESYVKHQLAAAGLTETYTSSLIGEAWLQALRYEKEKALRVANPLTNDLAYLRPSLLASLAQVIAENVPHHERIAIFEIAKVYVPGDSKARSVDRYRQEPLRLTIVLSDTTVDATQLFRQLKAYADMLFAKFGLSEHMNWSSEAIEWPFAAGVAATIKQHNTTVGQAGLLDATFLTRFGVGRSVAALQLPLSLLVSGQAQTRYAPLPKFPAVKRDVALVVSQSVRYTDVAAAMKVAAPLLESVELFDVYRAPELGEGNISYTLHLMYRAADRTLTAKEVDAEQEQMLQSINKQFNITQRS